MISDEQKSAMNAANLANVDDGWANNLVREIGRNKIFNDSHYSQTRCTRSVWGSRGVADVLCKHA